MLLTGCGKSFTDYPNKWVSTEYHIEIDPKQETAIIDYPEIDKDKTINVLSHGKKQNYIFVMVMKWEMGIQQKVF